MSVRSLLKKSYQPERDTIFAEPPSNRTVPATYEDSKNSKKVINDYMGNAKLKKLAFITSI